MKVYKELKQSRFKIGVKKEETVKILLIKYVMKVKTNIVIIRSSGLSDQ